MIIRYMIWSLGTKCKWSMSQTLSAWVSCCDSCHDMPCLPIWLRTEQRSGCRHGRHSWAPVVMGCAHSCGAAAHSAHCGLLLHAQQGKAPSPSAMVLAWPWSVHADPCAVVCLTLCFQLPSVWWLGSHPDLPRDKPLIFLFYSLYSLHSYRSVLPVLLTCMQSGWLSYLWDSAMERKWLFAVYAVVVLLPFALLSVWLCPNSGPGIKVTPLMISPALHCCLASNDGKSLWMSYHFVFGSPTCLWKSFAHYKARKQCISHVLPHFHFAFFFTSDS